MHVDKWPNIMHEMVNPFVPNAPFPYPMKTENLFQGVEKWCIGNEWVHLLLWENYMDAFK